MNSGPKISETTAISLSRMLIDGPDVSLNGSPTVSPTTAQGRKYIEISRITFDIDGDFDDTIILQTSNESFNVPELREVDGLGVELGWMYERAAWSLAYLRAEPFAPSALGDETASWRSYGIESMVFPFLQSFGRFSISPTLRIGVGLSWVKFPNSASDGLVVEDATYRSLGITLGVGGIVRLTGLFHIVADYTNRFLDFESVRGLDQRIKIDGSLDATAGYIKIGGALYLP